jgi:glc operon protein GlcG
MASLTLAEAERILQAAKAAALEMGVKMGISVVDPRGDLICMVRLDGAPWRTPIVSQGKAQASACFGLPSGELTDRSMTPVMRAMMHFEGGRFIPGQGALPIIRNGELIGAIGCSGGTSQQDEDVARAGLRAL